MENKRASDAISDSNDWLKSAEIQMENELYSKALYSLEMALEVALKAVMISLDADFPKSHNIFDVFEEVIDRNKGSISKKFIEKIPGIKNTFMLLLMYRNASGYSFDSNISKREFEMKSKELIGKVKTAVADCADEARKHSR